MICVVALAHSIGVPLALASAVPEALDREIHAEAWWWRPSREKDAAGAPTRRPSMVAVGY